MNPRVMVAELIILLVVLGGAAYLCRSLWARFNGWRLRRRGWHVEVEPLGDGSYVQVQVEKYGEVPVKIAAIPSAHPDFESLLYEKEAEGRNRAIALNIE